MLTTVFGIPNSLNPIPFTVIMKLLMFLKYHILGEPFISASIPVILLKISSFNLSCSLYLNPCHKHPPHLPKWLHLPGILRGEGVISLKSLAIIFPNLSLVSVTSTSSPGYANGTRIFPRTPRPFSLILVIFPLISTLSELS
ncbi:141aa long hypothetical protein [Pyrococcus horikoshii OT3]|uniref:Uncharacterized protein n=1 Tax=Pyrococcus horikoshii (strain ATCC 700860 / DSM 12428 / JCM 9974 / NBRC 100139 / OT-3) TaxID=70601 RepID=O58995_PYRHO|nr:141aa long hypothetical protein [Pyrococcus horikoshii OT3]